MAGEDRQASGILGLSHGVFERRHYTGTGAPRDVEPGYGVARADRPVSASLGPADDGEEADAALAQPRALLAGGEFQVRLCPLAGPFVLFAVEPGVAEPVLCRELERILDAHPALFRRVDEEQPAERPPGLSADIGPRLLVDEDHAATGSRRFRGGDEARQPPSDHQDICGQGRGRHVFSVES
jgi:hypothetical protein